MNLSELLEKLRSPGYDGDALVNAVKEIYEYSKADYVACIYINYSMGRFDIHYGFPPQYWGGDAIRDFYAELPKSETNISSLYAKVYIESGQDENYPGIYLYDADDVTNPNKRYHYHYFKDKGIKSEVVLPIRSKFFGKKPRTIGILALGSKKVGGFGEQDGDMINQLMIISKTLSIPASWSIFHMVEKIWREVYGMISRCTSFDSFLSTYSHILDSLSAFGNQNLKYVSIWTLCPHDEGSGIYLIQKKMRRYGVDEIMFDPKVDTEILELNQEHKEGIKRNVGNEHTFTRFIKDVISLFSTQLEPIEVQEGLSEDVKVQQKKKILQDNIVRLIKEVQLSNAVFPRKKEFANKYKIDLKDRIMLVPITDGRYRKVKGMIAFSIDWRVEEYVYPKSNLMILSHLVYEAITRTRMNKVARIRQRIYELAPMVLTDFERFLKEANKIIKEALNVEASSIYLYNPLLRRLELKETSSKIVGVGSALYHKVFYDANSTELIWQQFSAAKKPRHCLFCAGGYGKRKNCDAECEVVKYKVLLPPDRKCQSLVIKNMYSSDMSQTLGVILCVNKSVLIDGRKVVEYFSEDDCRILIYFADYVSLLIELMNEHQKGIEHFSLVKHEVDTQSLAIYSRMEDFLKRQLYRDKLQKKQFRDISIWAYNINLITESSNILDLKPIGVQRTPIRLFGDVIVKWINYFKDVAEDKGILIEYRIEDVPSILADRNLIEMVFYNLLKNEVNYSYLGTKIKIIGTVEEKYGVVNFVNYGIPLLNEDFERIFEFGYRTLEAKDIIDEGTGIGLALVRHIVERLLGGKVTVESEFVTEKNIWAIQAIKNLKEYSPFLEKFNLTDEELALLKETWGGERYPLLEQILLKIMDNEYKNYKEEDFDWLLKKKTHRTTFKIYLPQSSSRQGKGK